MEIRKLDTFNNANGINSSQRIIMGIPPKYGDKESTSNAPPITTVQTEKVQVALAKPKASAPIAINHTSKVIRKSYVLMGQFIDYYDHCTAIDRSNHQKRTIQIQLMCLINACSLDAQEDYS